MANHEQETVLDASMAQSPVLKATGITKNFGQVRALDGAHFDVLPGECHALVGDNGAGKSTMVKVLSGVFAPDSGELSTHGRVVHFDNPQAARDIGMETVYQDLALATEMSSSANLFLGREICKPGLLGKLGFVDANAMREVARERLKSLAVDLGDIDAAVSGLSGGQRQAVAIARAVMWAEKLIFMDEPTAALGVAQTRMVLDLILRVKASGTAIVLISHNMSDVMAVSDRISVFRLGRCVASLKTAETTAAEVVSYITGAKEVEQA